MPLKKTDAGVLTKRGQEGFHGDGAPRGGRRVHSHGKAAWQVMLIWVPPLCPRHSAPSPAWGCLQAMGASEAVSPARKALANPRAPDALGKIFTQAPWLSLSELSGLSLRELGAPGPSPAGSGPPLVLQHSLLLPDPSPFLSCSTPFLPSALRTGLGQALAVTRK